MSTEITIEAIRQAAARIAPYILKTPCLENGWLSDLAESPVSVKWESLQYTGSFKLRGALNKMIYLKERGVGEVLAISAGNHGLGVAHAARLLGMQATIVVPASAAPTKVEAIRRYGVELTVLGQTYDEAEAGARALAERRGVEFVSPYNDPEVIAGQGTIALEMLAQAELDTLLVSVGGGGLLAGVAIAARSIKPDIKIYGVQAANSTAMQAAFRAGEIVNITETDTCADGLTGNIEAGSITVPIIHKLVDDIITVPEPLIEQAIFNYLWHDHLVVEGSGAVTAGALMERDFPKARIGLIASGRNIDLNRLMAIAERFSPQRHRGV